jgi:glucosamine--fructose-6-phosphate aminotransferase (isomerizing)
LLHAAGEFARETLAEFPHDGCLQQLRRTLFTLSLSYSEQVGVKAEKVAKALAQRYIGELLALPQKTETILAASDQVEKLAELYYRVDDFMFLGRAIHYPVAMDGALKLKEVSYIHAEGYPTGEPSTGRTR